ncbi:hypothetical protein EDD90_3380 [Streptomyces sp. Ag109_O5-1]|nr:hypothetical protein EDD90_3380 [Streptomyces sp. Ag109_O5-1]
MLAASCRVVLRVRTAIGFCQCWAPHLLVQAGSTAMIAIPVASAMEVSRARSLPVGMPEMSCRNRRLRPCLADDPTVSRLVDAPATGGKRDVAAMTVPKYASVSGGWPVARRRIRTARPSWTQQKTDPMRQ